MEDGGLQLVVQLLTLIHPTVHGRVQEQDQAEDDDEGNGEVGIEETNDADLDTKRIMENLSRQSTWTKIRREY